MIDQNRLILIQESRQCVKLPAFICLKKRLNLCVCLKKNNLLRNYFKVKINDYFFVKFDFGGVFTNFFDAVLGNADLFAVDFKTKFIDSFR